MAYVDGYVLPVPLDRLDAYRQVAARAGQIWRDHGALEYRECVGEDLEVKELVPFSRSVELKPGETVVFSWIMFESREHRDRVNAKVLEDPRMSGLMQRDAPIFDDTRMIYGGFDVLVDV